MSSHRGDHRSAIRVLPSAALVCCAAAGIVMSAGVPGRAEARQIPPAAVVTPQPGTGSYPAATSRPTPRASPAPSTAPSPSKERDRQQDRQAACGTFDVPCRVRTAINGWFTDLVRSAINPVIGAVGRSLLSTPQMNDSARVQGLWTGSLAVADTCFVLLIVIGGITVMGHQTVQSAYTVKDIAPRLVVGMVAAHLSLFVVGKAIYFANGLSAALASQGVPVDQTAQQLSKIMWHAVDPVDQGAFVILVVAAAVLLGLVLVLMFIIRLMLTVLLIAAAPLALACHALPQTEHLAKLWWRAFAGLLAIQVAQALVFITAMKVAFTTDMVGWFGLRTPGDQIDLWIVVCLLYVLVRIPSWIARMVGVGRSPITRILRSVAMIILFRHLFPRGAGAGGGRPPRPPRPPRSAAMGGDGAVLAPRIGRRAPRASWPGRGGPGRGRWRSLIPGGFRRMGGRGQGPAVRGGDGSATPNVLGHAPRVSWGARQRRYPPGRNVPGMRQRRYRDGHLPPGNERRYPAQAGEPNPRSRRMRSPMPPTVWPYNLPPRPPGFRQQALFGNTAPYRSPATPGIGEATYARQHRMRWHPQPGQITTTPRPIGTSVPRVSGQIRMPAGAEPFQPMLPGMPTGLRPGRPASDPPASSTPTSVPPSGARRTVRYRQSVLFRIPGGLRNARRTARQPRSGGEPS